VIGWGHAPGSRSRLDLRQLAASPTAPYGDVVKIYCASKSKHGLWLEARRDELGREATLQHGEINEMGQRLLQLRPIPGVGVRQHRDGHGEAFGGAKPQRHR
jgi:hypothetical protein